MRYLSRSVEVDPRPFHTANLTTSVRLIKPARYQITQNYPNPFNPTTNIQFDLPKESFVTLKVYNLLGQELATLVDEKRSAGRYQIQFNGASLPSGIYFYRLTAGDFVPTKKCLLLK